MEEGFVKRIPLVKHVYSASKQISAVQLFLQLSETFARKLLAALEHSHNSRKGTIELGIENENLQRETQQYGMKLAQLIIFRLSGVFPNSQYSQEIHLYHERSAAAGCA